VWAVATSSYSIELIRSPNHLHEWLPLLGVSTRRAGLDAQNRSHTTAPSTSPPSGTTPLSGQSRSGLVVAPGAPSGIGPEADSAAAALPISTLQWHKRCLCTVIITSQSQVFISIKLLGTVKTQSTNSNS
ncbi:unnamed protein product, partial [Tilletia controversa]